MSGNTFDGGQGTGNVVRGSTKRARDKKLRYLAHVVHLAACETEQQHRRKFLDIDPRRAGRANEWTCVPGSSGAALIKLNCSAFLRRWCGVSYEKPSHRFARHFFRKSVRVPFATLSRRHFWYVGAERLLSFTGLKATWHEKYFRYIELFYKKNIQVFW